MDMLLKGRTALITGSTAGIGYAIANRFLQEGVKVFINGRTQERVNDAVEKLKQQNNGAEVAGVAADFLIASEVTAITEQIPQVDILVNNVGIFDPKAFTDIADEDWMRFFEVNVLSGVRLSRFYFPKMIAANQGRIIFISSES